MYSVEDKIFTRIAKCGRGTLVFPADLTALGDSKAVSKALERLTDAGRFIRVARGIYCYPKIDKKLGLGVIFPTVDEIVEAIAKRDKSRIVPTGVQALNKLGLSTQVPMNHVYFTDGTARKIALNYGTIQLKRIAPKNLSFTNKTAMLVTFALKEIGQENVTAEQLAQIKTVLQAEKKERVMVDAKLMPVWIRNLIKTAYE